MTNSFHSVPGWRLGVVRSGGWGATADQPISPRVVKLREITRDEELIKMQRDVLTRHRPIFEAKSYQFISSRTRLGCYFFFDMHDEIMPIRAVKKWLIAKLAL